MNDEMDLRDRLAISASGEDVREAMLGEPGYRDVRSVEFTRQEARYRHADKMLKAREKK